MQFNIKTTIEQSNKPTTKYSKYNYYSRKPKVEKKLPKVNFKKKKKKKIRKQRTYENRVPKKYSIYIKSVHWENRKNEYWQKCNRKCAVCGSCKHISLHHGKYDNNSFGHEPDSWLFPLCGYHHNDFHEGLKTKADMLSETLEYINDNYIPHDRTDV